MRPDHCVVYERAFVNQLWTVDGWNWISLMSAPEKCLALLSWTGDLLLLAICLFWPSTGSWCDVDGDPYIPASPHNLRWAVYVAGTSNFDPHLLQTVFDLLTTLHLVFLWCLFIKDWYWNWRLHFPHVGLQWRAWSRSEVLSANMISQLLQLTGGNIIRSTWRHSWFDMRYITRSIPLEGILICLRAPGCSSADCQMNRAMPTPNMVSTLFSSPTLIPPWRDRSVTSIQRRLVCSTAASGSFSFVKMARHLKRHRSPSPDTTVTSSCWNETTS